MCSGSFETRSLPSLLAATHRGFTFYVAFPKSSIRALGLPIYVAASQLAPLKLARCPACGFTLITRTAPMLAPATLAALPSTRAIPDRDVFYVADPISSIRHNRSGFEALN